nr:Gap-Pol polyprotein [Haemonchus contortus]
MFNGLQCLVYVAGFQGAEFADYRTRPLKKLDQGDDVTIKDLTAECQLIKSFKEGARMLENATNPSISVNYVSRRRNRKFFNRNKKQRIKKNLMLFMIQDLGTRNQRQRHAHGPDVAVQEATRSKASRMLYARTPNHT